MIPISELLLEYICPIAGGMTATVMFAAPLPDAYRAVRDQGHLGSLNPLPWAFMLGNCYGWVLYGVIQRNFFVYCANVPGLLFAIWLNLQAVKLQYKSYPCQKYSPISHAENEKSSPQIEDGEAMASVETKREASPAPLRMTQDIWILFMVLVWLLLTSVLGFQEETISPDTQQLLIGSIVNLNLVIFYAAPLSTIYTVLHTQSSASIHVPTMLTNTANGVFWFAYGLAVQDWFIAIPNGLGAALGATQMVLRVLFPAQKVQANEEVSGVADANVQNQDDHL
ncbi:solute carrier family 50 [Fistulifera solaris]|jgi:solute carrier family 50 protein (sugar transporter)|uniref:Solute carrier family 50 n=1 Tax=Fistulifera solaris TaxID=1519565 RepID=A0A1Z5K2Q6_FISSO|nr:solute carrier family 50 [Fistulifera solaris]|eukprot:GAX20550.1 solute carrier family 50 [Fistulifera solaris]